MLWMVEGDGVGAELGGARLSLRVGGCDEETVGGSGAEVSHGEGGGLSRHLHHGFEVSVCLQHLREKEGCGSFKG